MRRASRKNALKTGKKNAAREGNEEGRKFNLCGA